MHNLTRLYLEWAKSLSYILKSTRCPKNERRFEKLIKEKQKAIEMYGLLLSAQEPGNLVSLIFKVSYKVAQQIALLTSFNVLEFNHLYHSFAETQRSSIRRLHTSTSDYATLLPEKIIFLKTLFYNFSQSVAPSIDDICT